MVPRTIQLCINLMHPSPSITLVKYLRHLVCNEPCPSSEHVPWSKVLRIQVSLSYDDYMDVLMEISSNSLVKIVEFSNSRLNSWLFLCCC